MLNTLPVQPPRREIPSFLGFVIWAYFSLGTPYNILFVGVLDCYFFLVVRTAPAIECVTCYYGAVAMTGREQVSGSLGFTVSVLLLNHGFPG